MTSSNELLRTANGLHRAGNLDAAEQLYQRVLDQEPGNADALNLLGLLMQSRGRADDAATLLRQAVSADGTRPEFQENLAGVYLAMGRFAEAIAWHRGVLCLSPESPAAHNALGVALEFAGDYEAALECFREALRRQQDYVEAHNNLGAALKELGDTEGAIRSMNEAIRLKSGMAPGECESLHDRAEPTAVPPASGGGLSLAALRYNRAMMLLLAGDFDRGWPEYEWRLRLPGSMPPPWSSPR